MQWLYGVEESCPCQPGFVGRPARSAAGAQGCVRLLMGRDEGMSLRMEVMPMRVQETMDMA
jgi:hypothetical protein